MNTPFDGHTAGETVALAARRVRPRYQRGLLGWFRDAEPAAGLGLVSSALDHLAEAAGPGGVHDLFQAAWTVSEALRDGSLTGGNEERRLFRLLDGEIKRLGDQAEAVSASPDPELLDAFLRCAGGVATDTTTLSSAGADASVASAQGSDAEIYNAFTDEARREIDSLKEGLSQWRAGGNQPDALAMSRRALLSLRGGARLVGESVIATVAETAEGLLSSLSPEAQALSEVLDDAPELLAGLIEGDRLDAEVDAYLERAAASLETISPELDEDDLFADEDDADIVEMFLEEATELLDTLEQELAVWSGAPGDANAQASFGRTLNTLKRGARLADVTQVGDLCDATESLLAAVGEGFDPEQTIELARTAVVRLRQQAGELRERGTASPATDLIDMLEARAAAGSTMAGLPAFLADGESAAEAEGAGNQAVLAGPAGEIEAVRYQLGDRNAALQTDLVALDGLVSQLRRQVPRGGAGDIQEALLDEVERVRGNMGGHTEEIYRLLHRQSALLMQDLATSPDPPTESGSP